MRRNRRLTLEVMELRRLLAVMGPEDPARTPAWQSVLVELRQAEVVPEVASSNLKIRFRSTVSGSNEDANIDNVRIVGGLSAPAVDQLLAAGEL